MAYSLDFIKSAVEYKRKGHNFKQLEEAFKISSATYYHWVKKLDTRHYDIKVKRERHRKIDKNALRQALAEKPDSFLGELAQQFNCTPSAVFYALKKLKITRKKRVLSIRKNAKRNALNIWPK